MNIEREISITFSSGYQNFTEVETDCTEAQITTFAQVCSSVVGSAVSEVAINDVKTISFGSGE